MGLPAFLDVVPHCVVRAGHLHMDFGEMALVLPIKAWYRNIVLGNEAIAKWDSQQRGEVVQLRPPGAH